MIKSQVWDTL